MTASYKIDDETTLKEKIALLGKDSAIDTKDAFGKYLFLNDILKRR